jgi:hypothetical protein
MRQSKLLVIGNTLVVFTALFATFLLQVSLRLDWVSSLILWLLLPLCLYSVLTYLACLKNCRSVFEIKISHEIEESSNQTTPTHKLRELEGVGREYTPGPASESSKPKIRFKTTKSNEGIEESILQGPNLYKHQKCVRAVISDGSASR